MDETQSFVTEKKGTSKIRYFKRTKQLQTLHEGENKAEKTLPYRGPT